MVRWHRSFLVQEDNKQDLRSRSGWSNVTLFRKPVLLTHNSKQMEENYFDTEGTNLVFVMPGFQMLLSLLMICAVLGKTPAARSTKYHHHLKWCVKIRRVVFFKVSQKIIHHCLISLCLFQAATSPRKKTPGTQRQFTCLGAEGKALVDKSPSFHLTHSNQPGSLPAWVLLSQACFSPFSHA